MNINWQTYGHQAANGVRCATSAAGNMAGHVFNCLALIKDDASTLNCVLSAATDVIAAVRHARALRGENLLIPDLEESLDKTAAVIDFTSLFSTAYYFFSGTFFEDLRDWHSSGPFKAISEAAFAAIDCMEIYTSVDEMLQAAQVIEVHQNTAAELLEDLGKAFLIVGYSGQIAAGICDMAAGQIKDPVAWLDLAAAVAGIAIPILVLSNAVIVPLLIALGLVSCACSVASTICASYQADSFSEGAGPDFTSDTQGISAALEPIPPLATLLEDRPAFELLVQMAADVRPFSELTDALAIFTWLKECFHPTGRQRFWQRENTTGWKIGSCACAAIQSGMDMAAWLGSVGAVNSAFRRNPLFKALRSVFVGAAAGLSAADSSIALSKLQPKWQAREFKARKWQVLSATLNPHPAMPQVGGWSNLQADLVAQYGSKIQSDLACNGQQVDGGNRYWISLQNALAGGQIAAYLALKSPARRLELDEMHVASLLCDDQLHAQLQSGTLTADEAARVRAQTMSDSERARTAREILSPTKKQKLTAQALNIRGCDAMQVVQYKKELSDWKFCKLDVKKTNAIWQLSSALFKVAIAIAGLVAIFFAPAWGAFPSLLSLGSAAVSSGKYFVAGRCEKLPPPKAPAASAAA